NKIIDRTSARINTQNGKDSDHGQQRPDQARTQLDQMGKKAVFRQIFLRVIGRKNWIGHQECLSERVTTEAGASASVDLISGRSAAAGWCDAVCCATWEAGLSTDGAPTGVDAAAGSPAPVAPAPTTGSTGGADNGAIRSATPAVVDCGPAGEAAEAGAIAPAGSAMVRAVSGSASARLSSAAPSDCPSVAVVVFGLTLSRCEGSVFFRTSCRALTGLRTA